MTSMKVMGVIALVLWSVLGWAQPCMDGDTVVGLDASGRPVCQAGGHLYLASTYMASFGLNLTGNTFSVDTGEVQARILGRCPKGSAIRKVHPDGSVACAAVGSAGGVGPFQARVRGSCEPFGAIQAIGEDGKVLCWGGSQTEGMVFDSGWTAAPFGARTILDFQPSKHVFVQGLVRGMSRTGGRLISPVMSASTASHAPAYQSLGPAAIGLRGAQHLMSIKSLGDRSDLLLSDGEVRLRAFSRPADFDSGYVQCDANRTIRVNHPLGRFPTLAMLELAQRSDGSGWRVPVMGTSLYGRLGWRQTAMVQLNDRQAVIRTGSRLASFLDIDGKRQTPLTGFYRLRLFDWTPDFDSGWQPISTAAGQRDRRMRHDFGRQPSLVMVYVAQRAQDAQWCLPAMGGFHYQHNHGTGVYSMDSRFVVIKGGSANLAHFIDHLGKPRAPIEGVVRVLAWR